ncbi:hypothetical protein [Novosphingobium sp.]|uniref:hypothetical protein n=1 Tax=Novosphingobium sp. TaxID=1874826 RepID=UPI003B52158C
MRHSCKNWHQTPTVRHLLDDLRSTDLRLALTRGDLTWHAASDHGATTFAALARLRGAATDTAFASAPDDHTRAAALTAAQSAPTVPAVIAAHFGDPLRWQGYEPLDATRRFRANCA